MTLTFTGLGALVVVAPPPYVFLVGGLLLPFSNCPLLMASSILVPQSHSSPNELIGNCEHKGQSCHLVIWSRSHEYGVLSKKYIWSYYQSLGLEFRYALGKVLGTQDHPTLRLAFHHRVLYLNIIKSNLNTCIYTYPHTNIHLNIQYDIFIPKQHSYQPKTKRDPNTKETIAFI